MGTGEHKLDLPCHHELLDPRFIAAQLEGKPENAGRREQPHQGQTGQCVFESQNDIRTGAKGGQLAGAIIPSSIASSCFRCVQQASDCKPRDKSGQFIHEWLVGGDAKRLSREQFAVPHKNAALAH